MPIDMKEMIAKSTVRLLMEKNVKKLTVKDIVEECRITRQAFYYHFEDIPALFRWILEKDSERMLEETLAMGDIEKGLKHFFIVAIEVSPYIKRGLETNYGEKLQQLLYGYCYTFFEQVVEREHLYQGYSYADIKLFLRYHSHAIMGLIQEWTEEDTKHLDEIVHKLRLLMDGKILPKESRVLAE